MFTFFRKNFGTLALLSANLGATPASDISFYHILARIDDLFTQFLEVKMKDHRQLTTAFVLAELQ